MFGDDEANPWTIRTSGVAHVKNLQLVGQRGFFFGTGGTTTKKHLGQLVRQKRGPPLNNTLTLPIGGKLEDIRRPSARKKKFKQEPATGKGETGGCIKRTYKNQVVCGAH